MFFFFFVFQPLFSNYLMNILLSNLNGKYFHYFRSLSERKSRNVIKKLEQLKREFLVYCKQNHFSPIFHSFFLSLLLGYVQKQIEENDPFVFPYAVCYSYSVISIRND